MHGAYTLAAEGTLEAVVGCALTKYAAYHPYPPPPPPPFTATISTSTTSTSSSSTSCRYGGVSLMQGAQMVEGMMHNLLGLADEMRVRPPPRVARISPASPPHLSSPREPLARTSPSVLSPSISL